MKKTILVLSAATLVMALAVPATTQPAKQWFVTGGVGYAGLSDLTITARNGEKTDRDNPTPDGSIAVGGGFFYEAMPKLALGAEVSWLNFGTQTIGGSDDSYYSVPITGQALYMIPNSSRATPFLTGGAGLYHLRNKVEGISDTATSNVFGFNVGGGVKIETGMSLAFGVDVRFHMAVSPELTFALESGDTTFETTNWKMLTLMGKIFVF